MATLLVVLVTVLGVVISIEAYHLVMKIISKRTGADLSKELSLPIEKSNIFDFLTRANLPILVFALARFVFSLVMELVDTVVFLIEYHSDYRAMEIVTILINFTLLFILLVASYLVASCIKNALILDSENEEVTDKNENEANV